MDDTGVKFTESSYEEGVHVPAKFTFSVDGDKEDYLRTVQVLLRLIGLASDDIINQSDRSYIATLIDGMLPNLKQFVEIPTNE